MTEKINPLIQYSLMVRYCAGLPSMATLTRTENRREKEKPRPVPVKRAPEEQTCGGAMEAQGEDMNPERERPWHMVGRSPTAAEGVEYLNELKTMLTGRQLTAREKAFEDALKWVGQTCPAGGGCGEGSYSFYGNRTRKSSIRVDVEINRCRSFIQ